uniref:Uncharacterized protein n=1 Tax=Homalodisca liturata TaxID=320908 RepID=A0A1B6IV61_9HEMI
MANEIKRNNAKKLSNALEQRNLDHSKSSLEGKFDHLSYSYSCVKAFKDNKAIIGNLAALHEAQYQGLEHQPGLYTLSGERERPICQPFYFSSNPESDAQTDYGENVYAVESLHFNQSPVNQRPESEQEFFNKKLSLQWLKYQFKYINSLWPYIKESVLPKVCRRNQKMKMEMLLNQMDEETKHKLKEYVNKLDLTIQERHSLCNESIIEIDITPLMTDPSQLQAFLTFLNTIESNTSKGFREDDQYCPKTCEPFGNKVAVEDNLVVDKVLQGHSLFQTNKNGTLQLQRGINEMANCDRHNDSKRKTRFENPSVEHLHFSTHTGHRGTVNKNNTDKEYELGCSNLDYSENNWFNCERMYNCESNRMNSILDATQRPRLKSTITTKQRIYKHQHDNIEKGIKRNYNTNLVKDVICTETSFANYPGYNRTNRIEANGSPGKNYSCKCLLHQTREDYNRYREQCLFGKGDEESYNLLKYVADSKLNSKYKIGQSHNSKNNSMYFGIESEEEPQKENVFQKFKHNEEGKLLVKQSNTNFARKSNSLPFIDPANPIKTGDNYKLCPKKVIVNSPKKDKLHKKNFSNKNLFDEKNAEVEQVIQMFTKKTATNDAMEHLTSCDSSEKNSQAPNEFRVVRVEDIEKLLCAINYSTDNFCDEKWMKPNKNRGMKDVNRKHEQFSVNACYESLNYSINSFAWNKNNSEKESISTSCSQPNNSSPSSYDHSNKHTDSFSLCSSYCHSEQSGKSERYTKYTETNKKQSNYEHEVIKYKGNQNFMENHQEEENCYNSWCKPIKNANLCEQTTKQNREKHQNANWKVVLNNEIGGELEDTFYVKDKHGYDTFDLNKYSFIDPTFKASNQIKINNSKFSGDNTTNQSLKPQNTRMVIKINPEIQAEKDFNSTKMPKKHLKLNAFTPKKLYRSISSIFKRNGERLSDTNQLNLRKLPTKWNTNSDKERKIVNGNNTVDYSSRQDCCTDTSGASTASSNMLSTDTLILANLEKLCLEVQNHRDKINLIQEYLHQQLN